MTMSDLTARIESVIEPAAGQLLEAFFDPAGPFAGTTFDDLPDNPPGRFTAGDLVAATLLDMRFAPRAVRAILDARADELGRLLAAVPDDVDLWDATDEHLEAARGLYRTLRSGGAFKGIGPTTTSKLLSRKRPRLIPIVDSVVRDALELTGDYWAEMRGALQEPGLPARIERIRPPGVGPKVSTLRLLDAAVWMRYSNGRAARAARDRAGMSDLA
jgi:hypothetical protein